MLNSVELTKVDTNELSLASTYYQLCVFCGKGIKVTAANEVSIKRLSNKIAYCPFCLRNNFHFRPARNVLIMSFRGIFGYYYHQFYLGNPRKIWLSEMQNILEKQISIGLQHPALNYDPGPMLWFVDFNKIGKDKNKIPFDDVLTAVKSMFDVMLIDHYFKTVYVQPSHALWDKFAKALTLFHQQRKRPKEKRMLIPTLFGLVPNQDESFFEDTRLFCKASMILT